MHYGPTLLTLCALLVGCTGATAQERRPMAWDGLGQDPNRPAATKRHGAKQAPAETDPNRERERVLGTLRPYSDAWWVVHDEIEAEKDRQLGSKLVICPRCVPQAPPPQDTTGTIR